MPAFVLSSRSKSVRPLSAFVLAMTVAAIAACGSDNNNNTVTGPPTSVVGTYSLTTVDGSPLPYTVPNNPNNTIIIQSATVVLSSNNTYSIGGTGTSDGGDPGQVVADTGAYSYSSGTVTFTSTANPGLVYTATATSTGLTETVPGAFAGSTNTSFTLVLTKTG